MMNGQRVPVVGRDIKQSQVLVNEADVFHAPHETMAYFEVRFIGRRRRSDGEWGNNARMYRCFLKPEEVIKIMSDINQLLGGNMPRIPLAQDELEESSE